MDNAEIADRLKKIVVDHLGAEESKVVPSASFVDDFDADSLDLVEMLMAVEEEFDCEFSNEEAEKVITVQDAIDLISKGMAAKAA
jgi:acyl carrier protein